MNPPVCPSCKKNDGLSITKKVDHELSWDSAAGEYRIGKRCNYQDVVGDCIINGDTIECDSEGGLA